MIYICISKNAEVNTAKCESARCYVAPPYAANINAQKGVIDKRRPHREREGYVKSGQKWTWGGGTSH